MDYLIGGVVGLILGAVGAYLVARGRSDADRRVLEAEARSLRERAESDAVAVRREAELAAKAELLKAREEQDRKFEAPTAPGPCRFAAATGVVRGTPEGPPSNSRGRSGEVPPGTGTTTGPLPVPAAPPRQCPGIGPTRPRSILECPARPG